VIRGPQPETVRDCRLLWRPSADASWRELARIEGNYQRLVRRSFPTVRAQAVRLHILATNGAPIARVYEVRAYG